MRRILADPVFGFFEGLEDSRATVVARGRVKRDLIAINLAGEVTGSVIARAGGARGRRERWDHEENDDSYRTLEHLRSLEG
jgi:hypothetical protein